MSRGDWSFVAPPPPGWDRIIPSYKVVRALRPASRPRYRTECPFESLSDNSCWQFGDRELVAGEIIETKFWPHPSFLPQNYSAEKVLAFFNGAMKSRLGRTPWVGDRIVLNDGLSGTLLSGVQSPKPEPFDTRPAA